MLTGEVVQSVDDVEVLGTEGQPLPSSPRTELPSLEDPHTAELPNTAEVPSILSTAEIPSTEGLSSTAGISSTDEVSSTERPDHLADKRLTRGSTAPTNVSPPQKQYPQHEGSFSVSYKAYLRAMSCALVNMLPFPWRARQPRCVLLGRRYDFSDPDDHEAFKSDFTSRMLFTYRHGFQPLTASHNVEDTLPGTGTTDDHYATTVNRKFSSFFRQRRSSRVDKGLTSDSGWGCMIRVFQMAMAQVLMQLYLGRDWRRPVDANVITIGRKEVLSNRCRSRNRRSFSFDTERAIVEITQSPAPGEILSLLNQSKRRTGGPLHHNSNSMPLLVDQQHIDSIGDQGSDEIGGDSSTIENESFMHIYPWNLLPVLTLFRDVPAARFSLHRIVAVGRIALGIKAGAWFGPTSCSDSMALLISGSANLEEVPGNTLANQRPLTLFPPYASDGGIQLAVYHSKHGEISRKRVKKLFRHSPLESTCPTEAAPIIKLQHSTNGDPYCARHPHSTRSGLLHKRAASLPAHLRRTEPSKCHTAMTLAQVSNLRDISSLGNADDRLNLPFHGNPHSDAVVIFLSFRLGLDSFNMRYQPFLQSCFGMPQFQGLAGGGPLTSAYWFVAANDEHLYFLDPHSPIQPALRDVGQCVSIRETNAKDESQSTLSAPEAPERPTWLKQKQSLSTASEGCELRRSKGHQGRSDSWSIYPGLRINHEACSKESVDHMFFPTAPKQLNWRALNPSMTLVFLCQSFLAFEDLLLRLSEVDSEGLISVVEDEGYGISSDFGLHKSGVGPESRNLSFDSAEDGFYLL